MLKIERDRLKSVKKMIYIIVFCLEFCFIDFLLKHERKIYDNFKWKIPETLMCVFERLRIAFYCLEGISWGRRWWGV